MIKNTGVKSKYIHGIKIPSWSHHTNWQHIPDPSDEFVERFYPQVKALSRVTWQRLRGEEIDKITFLNSLSKLSSDESWEFENIEWVRIALRGL